MQLKELMTLPEFLAHYSISRTTAYREKVAGRLNFVKVGRRSYISRQDAQAWVEGLRQSQTKEDVN